MGEEGKRESHDLSPFAASKLPWLLIDAAPWQPGACWCLGTKMPSSRGGWQCRSSGSTLCLSLEDGGEGNPPTSGSMGKHLAQPCSQACSGQDRGAARF